MAVVHNGIPHDTTTTTTKPPPNHHQTTTSRLVLKQGVAVRRRDEVAGHLNKTQHGVLTMQIDFRRRPVCERRNRGRVEWSCHRFDSAQRCVGERERGNVDAILSFNQSHQSDAQSFSHSLPPIPSLPFLSQTLHPPLKSPSGPPTQRSHHLSATPQGDAYVPALALSLTLEIFTLARYSACATAMPFESSKRCFCSRPAVSRVNEDSSRRGDRRGGSIFGAVM
ncbi:hypothetical protein IWX50DRAFT_636559 [Phyllosticta citricarpa]